MAAYCSSPLLLYRREWVQRAGNAAQRMGLIYSYYGYVYYRYVDEYRRRRHPLRDATVLIGFS